MTRFCPFPRVSVGVLFVLVGGVLLLSGCDQGSLNTPDVDQSGDSETLFSSYVSIGNSITAGFQSSGIDSTTQAAAYPVLLADQMGTPFRMPTLNKPGCPPPFVQFFDNQGRPDPQRPAGTDGSTCALRAEVGASIHNVAVPGAKVVDVLSNSDSESSPNALTQFILGGRTQIQAALDVDPTFATVWIGNNDVLGPALRGTGNATPQSDFEARYTDLLDRLESSERLEGGVLVGVSNVAFTPFFSPGPVYETLERAGRFPSSLDVENCTDRNPDTGLSARVPLDYGFTLIGRALQGQSVTLDCKATGTPVLTPNEVSGLVQALQQYNAFIQEQANQRGLAYLDPNDVLRPLYEDQNGTRDPTDDPIPKFPNAGSDQPFGPFFSLDGIHPSNATHRLVADQLVQTINAAYETELSGLENVPDVP